jgi:hypothetical protein
MEMWEVVSPSLAMILGLALRIKWIVLWRYVMNIWTGFKAKVARSSRSKAEYALREGLKNLIEGTPGLTRESGEGKRIWEKYYSSKKGACISDLNAALANGRAAVQRFDAEVDAEIEAEIEAEGAIDVAALAALKTSLVAELALLREMRKEVQGNGKAAKEQREALDGQITASMKRLAETNA